MADKGSDFHGSCHCEKIKYTITLTDEQRSNKTAVRCNCTMCQKPGFTTLSVQPSAFKLTSPATKAELSDYQFRSKECHRYFCDKCGVQVFGEGAYEFDGKKYDFFSINFNTLDQPQKGLDLSKWSMQYWDGLHDNWSKGMKETPWEGGSL